jgi:hypothetical protein
MATWEKVQSVIGAEDPFNGEWVRLEEAEYKLTEALQREAALIEKYRWRKWPEERPGEGRLCEIIYGEKGFGLEAFDAETWRLNNVSRWRYIDGPEE